MHPFNFKENKLILAQCYTKTPSIRLLGPAYLTGVDSKNVFYTNPTAHPRQYTFGSVLPAQVVEQQPLMSFFKAHGIYNPLQYKLFKICENATLVNYAEKLLNEDSNPQILLYQEKGSAHPLSYGELKVLNCVDPNAINFIETDSPQLQEELSYFIDCNTKTLNSKQFDNK
jgi:hypothetical protein